MELSPVVSASACAGTGAGVGVGAGTAASQLPLAVQQLVALLFDEDTILGQMKESGINCSEMPLGGAFFVPSSLSLPPAFFLPSLLPRLLPFSIFYLLHQYVHINMYID